MMKKNVLIVLLLLGSPLIRAQEFTTLSLEQCRLMAVENSETIKIAEENIIKAQSEKKVAKSAYLPNISASAMGVYSKQEIVNEIYIPTAVFDPVSGNIQPNIAINPGTGEPIIGPDGNPVFNAYGYLPLDITIYGGAMAGVTAEQPLYAGGKILAGNEMASIGEGMAMENKSLKRTETMYEADRMFYIYLSTKEKVELAKKYQELLAKLVNVVNDSYTMGMTNRNELLKVQIQYNDASLQVQKAESGLKLSRMSLCRVIGVDLNTQLSIEDSIGNITFDPDSLPGAIAADRIEFQLLEKKAKMAEENIKMIQGDYMPTAGISFGYNYFNLGMADRTNYDSHGFNAIGSLKIPITTFGERKGKMDAAKADYSIKQLELQQAGKYLQLEIEQARLNLLDAYTRIEMTEEGLEQADENMRISRDSYDLGMETIVNMLEAQAEWQKAYSNNIDALTDFKVKESNYLRVTKGL